MTDRNLFSPPSAQVGDISPMFAAAGAGHFNPDGRRMPASAGWHWYGGAWRLFKGKPFAWWAVMVIVFLLFGLASVLPLLGMLASILMPVMVAGTGACAQNQMMTGDFRIGQVWAGFGARRNAQLQAGVLYVLVTEVSMGTMVLLSGGDLAAAHFGTMAEREAIINEAFSNAGLGALMYVIVMSVALGAIAFAPFLIHDQNVSVWRALVMSLKACYRNIAASLVWLLSSVLWTVLATLPIGLGWLVLLPVLCLTPYLAYRDIFYD